MSGPDLHDELESKGRRWLMLSSSIASLGAVLCILGLPAIGGWLTVGGLGGAAMGLHKLGRSGADSASG